MTGHLNDIRTTLFDSLEPRWLCFLEVSADFGVWLSTITGTFFGFPSNSAKQYICNPLPGWWSWQSWWTRRLHPPAPDATMQLNAKLCATAQMLDGWIKDPWFPMAFWTCKLSFWPHHCLHIDPKCERIAQFRAIPISCELKSARQSFFGARPQTALAKKQNTLQQDKTSPTTTQQQEQAKRQQTYRKTVTAQHTCVLQVECGPVHQARRPVFHSLWSGPRQVCDKMNNKS